MHSYPSTFLYWNFLLSKRIQYYVLRYKTSGKLYEYREAFISISGLFKLSQHHIKSTIFFAIQYQNDWDCSVLRWPLLTTPLALNLITLPNEYAHLTMDASSFDTTLKIEKMKWVSILKMNMTKPEYLSSVIYHKYSIINVSITNIN